VSFREDFADDNAPWLQMAQGLYREEAVSLATLLFARDKRGHVEILDLTGTSRGYFSPNRPEGSFE
jgi:hypothetical protein